MNFSSSITRTVTKQVGCSDNAYDWHSRVSQVKLAKTPAIFIHFVIVFLSPPSKCQDSTLSYTIATSSHVLSNSLLVIIQSFNFLWTELLTL